LPEATLMKFIWPRDLLSPVIGVTACLYKLRACVPSNSNC